MIEIWFDFVSCNVEEAIYTAYNYTKSSLRSNIGKVPAAIGGRSGKFYWHCEYAKRHVDVQRYNSNSYQIATLTKWFSISIYLSRIIFFKYNNETIRQWCVSKTTNWTEIERIWFVSLNNSASIGHGCKKCTNSREPTKHKTRSWLPYLLVPHYCGQ